MYSEEMKLANAISMCVMPENTAWRIGSQLVIFLCQCGYKHLKILANHQMGWQP